MDEVLLDTDILSEVLKRKNRQVLIAADRYLAEHQRFTFSAMTAYEIVRGLKARDANLQLREFLTRLETSEVMDVSLEVLMHAADLWKIGRTSGYPHNDADLIIAATALVAKRTLVTGNTAHYAWIKCLRLANWRDLAAAA